MRGLRLVSLLVAFVLAVSSAQAKPRIDAAAKEHTQRGYALYSAGQYLEASAEFEAAYSTLPDGGLLYNAAQAARLGGDLKRARTLYSSYVSFHPGEKNVADAKKHADELETQIAIEDAAKKPEVVVVQPPPPPPPKHEHHTPAIVKKWWFWTAIGGGLVVVAGATVLGVELSKTPRWSNTNDIGPGATPQSLTIHF